MNLKLAGKATICSRIIRCLLFAIGIVMIYRALDWVISDDVDLRARVNVHNYYNEEHVDFLFVGTSHTLYDINALAISEKTHKNAYNLSTSNQDFVQAYYLIKDAIRFGDVDHIILETSISRLKIKRADETATYLVSDYLYSPLNRALLIFHSFGPDKYVNSFLRLRRNFDPQKPKTLHSMFDLYAKKKESTYIEYAGNDDFMGKGQWKQEASIGNEALAINLDSRYLDSFTLDDVQEKELRYLIKIVELCKEKSVDLAFLISPYYECYFMRFEQYQELTDIVYDIAAKNGIDVIDFNLVKDEYYKAQNTDFLNYDHINYEGSYRMADFLAKYFDNPEEEYFYDDIRSKYPVTDGIKWAGYKRRLITDKGEYKNEKDAEGDISKMRIEVSAIAYQDIPTTARLCIVKKEDSSGVWAETEELSGESPSPFVTEFVLPYDNYTTTYKIQLLEPNTGEVLYEAFTGFGDE